MIFVTARRRQWITKGNKSYSIRKYNYNNPGAGVSLDQLQSAHPVLVLQFSGQITSARDEKHNPRVGLSIKKKPLKYGLPHLELKLKYIIQTMKDFLNNLSYQKLIMTTRI